MAQSLEQKAQSVGEKTGVNQIAGISPTTSDFVTKAAMSDMFEIKAGKLAEQKGDAATKSFADKMVTDHEKTFNELKSALKGKAPDALLPVDLDSAHQKKLDDLAALSGADFTKKYSEEQVSAHEDAVSLFDRYAKGGDDPTLKDWAGKTLPDLQHHLVMAKALDK